MSSNTNDQEQEDIVMETSNSTSGSASGSGTPIPMVSNPGTPRSMAESEVRQTPPPASATPTPSTPGAMNLSRTASPAHLTPSSSSSHLASPLQLSHAQLQQSLPKTSHQLPQSKYAQLLAVIEDMGKDIRPTYSGSRTSSERLKRGIVHARILVRECLMECERSARS